MLDEQPHNIEAEQGLLTVLLLEPGRLDDVSAIVRAEDFYQLQHGAIFQTMLDLTARGERLSAATLSPHLAGVDFEAVGGASQYLAELMGSFAVPVNAPDYARQIADFSLRRKIVRTAQGIIASAATISPDKSAGECLTEAEADLYSLADRREDKGAVPIITGIEEAIRNAQAAQQGRSGAVRTGIDAIDRKLGGFFPGRLYILGARPAMGKTGLALGVAENAAKSGKKVLFFSLEMERAELSARRLASATGISVEKQDSGNLSPADIIALQKAGRAFSGVPLYIEDTPALSLSRIRSKLRRQVRRHGVDIVVIDYLGLMQSDKDHASKVYEIQEITQGLKNLAKEFKIPVLLLCQLSRGVESRDDKRPLLSDLRDSGSIEQDADVVMFLYRHEYYLDQQTDLERKQNERADAYEARRLQFELDKDRARNKAELIIAKRRNGSTGTILLRFDKERVSFSDPDDYSARYEEAAE